MGTVATMPILPRRYAASSVSSFGERSAAVGREGIVGRSPVAAAARKRRWKRSKGWVKASPPTRTRGPPIRSGDHGGFADERAEPGEILGVLMAVRALRCFEHHRQPREAGIVDHRAETL